MTEKWMRRSEAASEIVKRKKTDADTTLFGPFVEGPYFDFYGRKWKESTAYMNQQRVRMHLVEPFRYRELSSLSAMSCKTCRTPKPECLSRSSIICVGT